MRRSRRKASNLMKANNRSGFTLVELMIVAIIIAALAGMVLPRIWPASDAAKSHIARGDIAHIEVALKLYRLHHNRFPATAEGLQVLLVPSQAGGWDGPFLEKSAVDPWGQPYRYRFPGTRNPSGFDLWSTGPDQRDGTADDIVNWE